MSTAPLIHAAAPRAAGGIPTAVHPVDQTLPAARLGALGLQHVLVMYAGAVAVPLIVGRALKMTPEQVSLLINADLLCCGLVTLIQALGIGPFGIRMPVMMGVTFASVGPMLAIGTSSAFGSFGILYLYGAVIASGIFGVLVAPFMSRLVRFFPPVVTGTIIAVIGVTLMRVGIQWAVGGAAIQPMIPDPAAVEAARAVGGAPRMVPNPQYAALDNMAVTALVLAVILGITRYVRGFLANIAVLAGLVVGYLVALGLGKVHLDKVAQAPWFDLITPFAFGAPRFDAASIVAMCLVMLVVMVESTGMFLALGEITERPIDRAALTRGLRVDGVGTVIGGVFNTFPYTSFSQNVGLVGITGVKSRWVCVAAAILLILLGLVPKMGALVESVPQFVLGGAGIVMFGMVAATGIKILSRVNYDRRGNLFVVAISVGMGMIPLVAPRFFQHMPHALAPILESGILLASLAAVALNLLFNGAGRAEDARAHAMAGAQSSDH